MAIPVYNPTSSIQSTSMPAFVISSSFFILFKQIHTFIFFSISLNPQRVQYHMDSGSNGRLDLSRKVALEFGMNHATVSMSSS